MSPPFSSPVPDEFVPRDVPAPSRISTTFLSPRYHAIVKSKQTLFRATLFLSRHRLFPTLAETGTIGISDFIFSLDYRASPFTLTFIPYDLLAPLLPYYLRSSPSSLFSIELCSFICFPNKIKFCDIMRDLSYVKEETLAFVLYLYFTCLLTLL